MPSQHYYRLTVEDHDNAGVKGRQVYQSQSYKDVKGVATTQLAVPDGKVWCISDGEFAEYDGGPTILEQRAKVYKTTQRRSPRGPYKKSAH